MKPSELAIVIKDALELTPNTEFGQISAAYAQGKVYVVTDTGDQFQINVTRIPTDDPS